MDPVLNAKDVVVGFHPAGYRIDKTASPMNRYTKWDVTENHWRNPKPVCFDSLPQSGWIAKDKFDWNHVDTYMEKI
ncbi:MAG TPA: hypothetical protein ENG35_06610 [Desulfobacteraceae bacterium]|nr:hypothetical protein [Desulfobacteraceae bacterium]